MMMKAMELLVVEVTSMATPNLARMARLMVAVARWCLIQALKMVTPKRRTRRLSAKKSGQRARMKLTRRLWMKLTPERTISQLARRRRRSLMWGQASLA